jgi:hypothetical protein
VNCRNVKHLSSPLHGFGGLALVRRSKSLYCEASRKAEGSTMLAQEPNQLLIEGAVGTLGDLETAKGSCSYYQIPPTNIYAATHSL